MGVGVFAWWGDEREEIVDELILETEAENEVGWMMLNTCFGVG